MQPSPAITTVSSPEASPTTYPLLTSDEALFHACLENITAQRCHVQCKPRLLEILHPENVAGFLKICQRHIDFLIYRKGDWLPMVAIEFEDDSPGKASRKTRDRQLVKDIFSTFGIPMLQVHAKDITDIDTLVHKMSTAWQQRNANLEIMPPPSEECAPHALTTRLMKAACSSIS
ncbi:DUF2726 domain-containing protein [Prosthecobacter sp.]|uniref:DUF2726 domain-containing protein n=1 Tax=Prosthecobacter sp. TaxID=1965333 RepID=UPI0024883723|nr:DUF2726 domain-containing protein [Prosthecobacter sp.]MDI1311972.1 DUF2726 domain-containing protein [Prosthecobacter sp.]